MLRIITKAFLSHSKEIHTTEIVSKMADLRHHIKQEEEILAALKQQVSHDLFRSRSRKQRPTKGTKPSMRNASDSPMISTSQNRSGLTPRRRARPTKQPSCSPSQATSFSWSPTSTRPKNWSCRTTASISRKGSPTRLGSSSIP